MPMDFLRDQSSNVPPTESLKSPASIADPNIPSFGSFVRLCRFFSVHPMSAAYHAEQWIVRRMAYHGLFVTRIALGIIFLWFGILKFLPMVLPIDLLAEKILTLITFHLFRPETCLHTLAFFECLIGLGMLTGRFLRLTVFLLFLQLPGTFLPLLLLHRETWVHFPFLPTFEGQYIIKNFVLISAGLIVGATVRGGRIIAHPEVAARAGRDELLIEEFAFNEREKSASEKS
ncbi:hypothetical protein [Granulicella mallensis]|uniref:Putative membrane protein YphA (DoxX/SURF4 family) n=1 Tax=Granulicella mallensis TaxID=940614 RepID=A0A7W7ZQK5_9BACT|nr:hypothetical protein [Granulicella mallensis]MBB5063959.1 putative membrane protein YphA (DoxX/SURF4 family) [Granulicella mallensis]